MITKDENGKIIIELTLPNPPTLNKRLGFSKKNGKSFKTKGASDFEKQVINILVSEKLYNLKLESRLSYYAEYYPPDSRRRDIDNFCTKSILDSLTKGGLYKDDTQIDHVEYKRMSIFKNDKEKGKIFIRIKEITT